MKIKDILISLGALLFAWLFYNQGMGLNCALLAVFVAAGLFLLNPIAVIRKGWWLSLGALVISAVCMVLYSNALSFFTLAFSMMLLSAYSSANASALLNFGQAGFSLVLAVPEFFRGWYLARMRKANSNTERIANNWLVYILVTAIFLLFVFMYSQASSAFGELLKDIDLSFISFGWLLTAGLGFFLLHGLFKHRRLKGVENFEHSLAKPLTASLEPHTEEVQYSLKMETKAGMLLLGLLNLLLLTVNVSDIVFLAKDTREAVNYPELVHQGVGALIMSIIGAISIILFFFRGKLNFEKMAKPLQILAMVWMLQNLFLIGTAGIKNSFYIGYVDGLTYKRIGVYYYLLLSGIGLFFTAVKLYNRKPNWYLVRVNFVAFFTVMVLSCPIDWDGLIVNYNMNKAARENKDADMHYLMQLSNKTLPQVVDWAAKANADTTLLHNYTNERFIDFTLRLTRKVEEFKSWYASVGWQTYSYYNQQAYNYLLNYDMQKLDISAHAQKQENERIKARELEAIRQQHEMDSIVNNNQRD